MSSLIRGFTNFENVEEGKVFKQRKKKWDARPKVTTLKEKATSLVVFRNQGLCALLQGGTIECVQTTESLLLKKNPPTAKVVGISGVGADFERSLCGVLEDGYAMCWSHDRSFLYQETSVQFKLPDHKLVKISVLESSMVCFHFDGQGAQQTKCLRPEGLDKPGRLENTQWIESEFPVRELASDYNGRCALLTNRAVKCWRPQRTARDQPFDNREPLMTELTSVPVMAFRE